MAMSVVYATINGQIVSENRGGVISYYAPDNLGSTVALLDATGTVTDTFTYWPYGEIQSHVGSSVTPFTFCGTLGYYLDVLNNFIYVRARYLRQQLARWQSVDPIWPDQRAYGYCAASPVAYTDQSGMSIVLPAPPNGISTATWQAIINELIALGLSLAEIDLVLLGIIAIVAAVGFACAQLAKQRYKACPSKPYGNPTNLRGCKVPEPCEESMRKLYGWADCLASQIVIDFLCFGGVPHGNATNQYMRNVLDCAKAAEKNCKALHNIVSFCFNI